MADSASNTPQGLAEALQKLARERSSGVLKVMGPQGWKVIEVQSGTITLVSTAGGKRLKIGEILVGRGKIPREAVVKSLEIQKQTGAPLGQILAERGSISRAEIQEVVRFQIEEELYDLFRWKGAETTFEPDTTLGTQADDYKDTARLAIDPQKVFAEISRRMPVWDKIERLLYSRYMTFTLSERGSSMLSTATRGGRRLLELVDAGYCVETIVRKAVVGSFSIWKALADLIDAQAIQAAPDSDLVALAEKYEAAGDIEQAWGVVMRLLEITTDRGAIPALQSRVRNLRTLIDEAESKGAFDVAPVVSRGKPLNWRVVRLVAVLVVVVGAAVAFPILGLARREQAKDARPYKAALKEASELEGSGDIIGARDVWEKFLSRYPKGMSAELAHSAKGLLDDKYDTMVELEIGKALTLEKENRFGEAIALFDDIVRRYPLNNQQARISDLKARADREWSEFRRQLSLEQLKSTLERGKTLLEEQRYSEASDALETVARSDAAGLEMRQAARETLEKVHEVEAKAQALVSAGKAKEEKGDLDEALIVYQQCYDLWSGSAWGRVAAERLTDLGRDKVRATRLYEAGVTRYEEGDFGMAVIKLKEAEKFTGFAVSQRAAAKRQDILAARERSTELHERAKHLTASGRDAEAFALLMDLVNRFPHSQIARELTFNVRIETVPAGAQVTRDNKVLGDTPLTMKVRPDESGVLVLSKKGFATTREKFSKIREPILKLHLPRDVVYRRSLGRAVMASPSGGNERFFVRSEAMLTSFIAESGTPVWQVEVGKVNNPRSKPVAFEDMVYVASGKGPVMGLMYSSGHAKQILSPPAPLATSPLPVKLSLLSGRVYVLGACIDGQVFSMNAGEGSSRWTVRVGSPIRFDMAASERLVFVPSPRGVIMALDLLTGQTRWQGKVPGEVAGDIAMDPDRELVGAISSLGEVAVFSAENGSDVCRVVLNACHGGGLIVGKNFSYVAGTDKLIRRIDMESRIVVWEQQLDGAAECAPALHDGALYVGTDAGSLVCLDAISGRVRWKIEAGSPVNTSPTVVGDRCIVVSSDGEVLGLDLSSNE